MQTKTIQHEAVYPENEAGNFLRATTTAVNWFAFPETTVTTCLLSLECGHQVLGVNYGALDAASHSAEMGEKLALQDAVNKALEFAAYSIRVNRFLEPSSENARIWQAAEAAENLADQQASAAPLFKIGDVVAFSSNPNARMTVQSVGQDGVVNCAYWDESFGFFGGYAHVSAAGDLLVKVSPDAVPVPADGAQVTTRGHIHVGVQAEKAGLEFARGDKVVCIDPGSMFYGEGAEVIGVFRGGVYCAVNGRNYGFEPSRLMHAAEFNGIAANTASTSAPEKEGSYTSPHGWTIAVGQLDGKSENDAAVRKMVSEMKKHFPAFASGCSGCGGCKPKQDGAEYRGFGGGV